MKSNKDLVYDLLKQCTGLSTDENDRGISTQYISKRLNIQRTNISSILNGLLKEKLVEKDNGRPVLYRIKHSNNKEGGLSDLLDMTPA